MQADQPVGATLRITLLSDSPGHSSSPQAGRQKFFPSISFSVDASSRTPPQLRQPAVLIFPGFQFAGSEIAIPP